MIVRFIMNQLMSFLYYHLYILFTIHSQSLKDFTLEKNKSNYILGYREYFLFYFSLLKNFIFIYDKCRTNNSGGLVVHLCCFCFNKSTTLYSYIRQSEIAQMCFYHKHNYHNM